jgi:glycerol-3-phosphate cytidylyltransferase-like family protein
MGDRLIVGVVSDENVLTYKPAPIMTLAERCEMLSACRLVDRVIPDPPLFCTCAFLDEIGAEFACHGDDMSVADLYYWYKDVIDGNRFRTVQYTEGISSRDIVRRVLDRRINT